MRSYTQHSRMPAAFLGRVTPRPSYATVATRAAGQTKAPGIVGVGGTIAPPTASDLAKQSGTWTAEGFVPDATVTPPGVPHGTVVQTGSSVTSKYVAAIAGGVLLVGAIAFVLTRQPVPRAPSRRRRSRR